MLMMILVLGPGSLDLMWSTSMKPSFAVLLGHQVSSLTLTSYHPTERKRKWVDLWDVLLYQFYFQRVNLSSFALLVCISSSSKSFHHSFLYQNWLSNLHCLSDDTTLGNTVWINMWLNVSYYFVPIFITNQSFLVEYRKPFPNWSLLLAFCGLLLDYRQGKGSLVSSIFSVLLQGPYAQQSDQMSLTICIFTLRYNTHS